MGKKFICNRIKHGFPLFIYFFISMRLNLVAKVSIKGATSWFGILKSLA